MALVKTLNGLAYPASVKMRNGLVVANIKTINGLDAIAIVYDSDAQDFFTRIVANSGTISDLTKGYVNTFVLAAKANGYWTKLTRINLFCGDQRAAAMVPLKVGGGNSVETSTGTIGTYADNTGLQGNGANYLTPGFNANAFSPGDFHFSVYDRTHAEGYTGLINLSPAYRVDLAAPSGGGTYNFEMPGGNSSGISFNTGGDCRGHWIGTNRSTSDHELYKNGASVATNGNGASNTLGSNPIYILASNIAGGASGNWGAGSGSKFCGGYSLGAGLSDTDAANFYTDMQAFQTSLGRNV